MCVRVFRGKLEFEYIAIWCWNKGPRDADSEFVFCRENKFTHLWVCVSLSLSLFSSFSFYHRYVTFCTPPEPLILPLSLRHTFLCLTHLTVFVLFLENLARDLPPAFPSFLPFSTHLMQSRPVTSCGHVSSPLITTELLSLCTQTKGFCLLRDFTEGNSNNRMKEGWKLIPAQVYVTFVLT